MWCEKCHYGSETVEWKLDSSGNFQCPQCGTLAPPLNKNPFIKVKSNRSRNEKQAQGPKKFAFDQKGGTDTENPAVKAKLAPEAKPPSEAELAPKAPEKPVERPVEPQNAQPTV